MWYDRAVNRDFMRYFVGFIIFIAIFILGFTLFHHSGPSKAVNKPLVLPSFAATSTDMQFTTDGPVVYDSNHFEIRITVGQDQNTIDVLQGYQGTLVKHHAYPNNESAYNEFLYALQLTGFTQTQKISGSDIGACATGQRFYLNVIDSFGTPLQHTWNSSCSEGTSAANIGAVQGLFQAQIPDYQTEVAGVQT
jgi:hypothetical protein